MSREKRTLNYIYKKKELGEKLSRTAVYDYPMAMLAEAAGIDILILGDSIAMVMLGYESTINAKLDIMVEHAIAVRKGAPTSFIMGDMPFLSYQTSIGEAIKNAGRYLIEANMDAVKVEGGQEITQTIKAMTEAGIPVIGHTGLTPQKVKVLGGYKTQGRDANTAYHLLNEVKAIEQAGAIAVVLESVPSEVTRVIYERIKIPVFGTGVGPYNDSPMINFYDMLGFFDRVPRFAKRYANIKDDIIQVIYKFVKEVKDKTYPGEEHSYHMLEGEEEKFLEMINNIE